MKTKGFKYVVVRDSSGWVASRHKSLELAEKSLKHYLRFFVCHIEEVKL